MPTYQLLTDRTLAHSSAITPTTLIHIVYTGDPSQNIAGSSYKAELGQLVGLFSAGTTSGEYLPLSGGTVSGTTNFTNGLTANTISATTYLNLPVTADTNFANTNLTLDNDRIHNLDGYDLFFSEDGSGFGYISFGINGGLGTGSFQVNGSTDSTITVTDTYVRLRQLNNEFWVNGTETVVNETGFPNNFRVETDSNQNMFFVDGTNNKVGISTNTPSETLDVSGKTKTINFQMTSGATNGYVLTSDASGNASWQSLVPPFINPGTASTINWDVSGVSNNYAATLTAVTTTLNVSNIRNGEYATIILTQDSSGSRTITLGTINGTSGSGRHKVSSGGGGSIFLTSNPNAIDILSCVYDGNILYWTVGNDYT